MEFKASKIASLLSGTVEGNPDALVSTLSKITTLLPGDVILTRAQGEEGGGRYLVSLDRDPAIQGALVAVDPASGYVRALVGGYDYRRSQFDRAIQARRQPGSAFKPIIYSAILDSLGYTQSTVVMDSPISLPGWTPRNFKNKYMGPQTLRNALANSLNSVSVRLTLRLGPKAVVDRARRLGITSPMSPSPSIALGSFEVSLLDLTKAYTVFAAGGRRVEPIFITMIRDRNGHILEDNRFINEWGGSDQKLGQGGRSGADRGSEPIWAISPQTAYLMTNMLEAVVERGTGRKVKGLGRPTAGKTGTNGLTDVWFVGYTPELVAGTWIGYDDRRPMGEGFTGGNIAAPVWLKFMKEALEGQSVRDFDIPEGIAFNYLNTHTGQNAEVETGGERVAFVTGTEHSPANFRLAHEDAAVAREVPGSRFRDRFARDTEAMLQRRAPKSDFQF